MNFSNTLLVLVNGEGHRDQLEEVKPNSISESNAQTLTKVQQLLNRPGAVYLVECGENKSNNPVHQNELGLSEFPA